MSQNDDTLIYKDDDTFEHVSIEIHYDISPANPRDLMDCFSTFYGYKSQYIVGGKKDIEVNRNGFYQEGQDFYSLDEFSLYMKKQGHFSKIFNTGNCEILAIVERQKVLDEWNVKRISPKLKGIVLNNLECEATDFKNWCNGDVYGFIVRDKITGENLDSCWGFYDGLSYIKDEAKEQAKSTNETIAGRKSISQALHNSGQS